MKRTSAWQCLCTALSAAAVFTPLAAFGQSPEVGSRAVVDRATDHVFLVVDEEGAKGDKRELQIVAIDADKPSEYWLGIGLGELPEIAKQQLGLEGGLVVADVMEDSPAAKAEFKRHDILVKAGDAALKAPADLLKIVDASQGKPIAIVLVRGGKDRKIEVAPVKRSNVKVRVERGHHEEVRVPNAEFREEIKQLEEALAKLKGKSGDGPLGLWFAKPAIVGAQGDVLKASELFLKDFQAEFPKDLSVRITKDGASPTKIRVNRGDQEWEVTEDKLGELPDDVRPHVQKLLGRMLAPGLSAAATRVLRVMPGGKVEGEIKIAPVPPTPPAAPKPPTAGAKPTPPTPPQVARLHAYRVESGGVEAKLDAIMKKLEQLSKEVDELQNRSSSDKK